MMLTLIVNAQVFEPQPRGSCQVLVGGTEILAIDDDIDLQGAQVEVMDAGGQWLIPGFVDALTHPCGGGGEGGFGNRTSEVSAQAFIRAGVTSPVGALGTDSIARSLDVLYGTTMALRERGLMAYMYTGAYRVPAPTLTGDIARDLMLVDPVIGVGELAISDHRSAQPTAQELRRVAADAALGGTLSGRGGRVMLHLGDGEERLGLMHEALAGSDLPRHSFYPTHVNRNIALLNDAADFAAQGGYIDITVSTTPELIAAGDLPPLDAFKHALAQGAPPDRVTFSSDAGGSLPLYENGELRGLTAASPLVMLGLLQETMTREPTMVAQVIAALTLNPANALALPDVGLLRSGGRADLLLIDATHGELQAVMCGGRWLQRDGQLHERASV